jgi:hypothetical protein
MGKSRVGDLFGTDSHSFLVTFTVDYDHGKGAQSRASFQNDSPQPELAALRSRQ